MKRAINEEFAKRVISFFENQGNFSKIFTVNHFFAEGKSRRTLYNIIKRYEDSGSANYKKIPGRPITKKSIRNKNAILKRFTKNPNNTVRKVAKELKISKSSVSKIKVHKLGIKARTRKKMPKYTKNHEKRAKSGCRFVYKKQLTKTLIIDDETYVTVDGDQSPSQRYYHSKDPKDVKYENKFISKTKFSKKYLVWQAIDEFGNVSDAFISDKYLDSQTYLNECIIARLIPFINRYHDINNVVFWPDLASVHYSNLVRDYLDDKIEMIEKIKNPPNVPQTRGIEMYWSICKRKYSNYNKSPKNTRGFKNIWARISKQVSSESGKSVMEHARKMLMNIGFKGISKSVDGIK